MTTPLTIISLSQGRLDTPPQSDEAYWKSHEAYPKPKTLPSWRRARIAWPRWWRSCRDDRG